MPELVQYCPLCSGEASSSFEETIFRGRRVEYRICRSCGMVYQSPRMTSSESSAFYTDEYRLFQEGSTDPTQRNIFVQNERARLLLEFSRPELKLVKRHLDIGCSTGILLQQSMQVYHCQAVGVEPGEAHRARAREQGFHVLASLDDLEKDQQDRFDLVSMSHVLEHLPDPAANLAHLRQEILSPAGSLLLEVPNLYAHDSFEVAHLCAFTTHTLKEILRLAGFEIIKMRKHGQPNSALIPLFITILCRPATKVQGLTVRSEHNVRLKRLLGMQVRRIISRILPKRAWLFRGGQ